MAEGLGRERWAHTSIICTLIANAHRDPKKHRPFTPDDFNPYAERGSKTRSHHGDAIGIHGHTDAPDTPGTPGTERTLTHGIKQHTRRPA